MTEVNDRIASIEQYVERHYRWNFLVNTLDGASFGLGMSFFSSEIVLPLFVSHFTANPLAIGLIGFLGWAGVLLPQLFTANAVERTPRKKFFPMTLGFFLERLPIFLLAPMIYFLAASQPILTLILFFVLYSWHNLGAGVIIVGWQDMIAKVIPVGKRGRFFGIGNFIGNGAGILGALAVPFVLGKFAFPLGYVFSFAVTGVLFFLSWVSVSLTREPAVHSSKPPVSQLDYLNSLPGILRRDRNFRMYLLSQIVFAFSGMATGFLVVYTVQNWNLPDGEASRFMVTWQIGLALANLFFGFLADRKGHKLSLEICWLMSTIALSLAIFVPNPGWFFLVFFLSGSASAGTFISGISIVYEFTEAENRPTYIGLANTIPGIVVSVAPLVGGWLAGVLNYRAMFILSMLAGVISWALLHFTVREPRHTILTKN
ncbi:MAG: MFS transporter [Anaerolineales bacterium]|jgi:MFS family permease|nr:MFS transporter [Anaerolineales bacterium]